MAENKKMILIVDDMELNRAILDELFRKSYHVIEASDGKEAMDMIQLHGKDIAIMLLDLIMPGMNGFQVLQEMNDRGLMKELPVIMITSENSEQAILKGYNMGASDVITKPFNPDIVRKRVENMVELNTYKLHLENKVNEQVSLIEKQAQELDKVNNFIIDTLSTIVEFRDLDSGQHIKRIRHLTRILLQAVARGHKEYGLTAEMINTISSASAMHDIGKIAIPDHILLKPGKLTWEEFEVMKTHTTKGCRLLDSLNYIHTSDYFKYSYDICRHHHERWDGQGYPDGLKGDQIPIWAQVVSLADVYDALTSVRVYKPAYSHEKAVKMILDGECGLFNPQLIQSFVEVKELIRIDEDLFSDLTPNTTRSVVMAIPDDPAESSITAIRERTLRLLELERKKYKILSELSGEVIFNYDVTRDLMEFSERCKEMLGCEECIEHFSDYILEHRCIYPKDQAKLANLIASAGDTCTELRLKGKNGSYQWFEVQAYVLSGFQDADGSMVYIGKLTNIHDRKMEKERLRTEADTDSLTKLFNHKAAREKIDKGLARRLYDKGALVFFDVDDFKKVNDTYGHLLGDEVLKTVGESLLGNYNRYDVQARIGGDEFILFLWDYGSMSDLEESLEKLVRQFRQVNLLLAPSLRISCSIGVARYPEDGSDYRALFAKADIALYCSKRKGKNQFTIYSQDLKALGYERSQVITRLMDNSRQMADK